MESQQAIGELLRQARQLSGLTVSQFGALLKVAPSTVSHLERDFGIGSNDLLVRALQVITRLLGAKYKLPSEDKWTYLACEHQLRTLLVLCRVGDLEASIQSLPPSAGA
jgi:transcriptional regulator with XRE-family HTH domain